MTGHLILSGLIRVYPRVSVALLVLVEVDRDRGGRSGPDRRGDFSLRELRVPEHDFAEAEADGHVRHRGLSRLLAIDEDLRPGGGVDVGAAARIERHAGRFAGLD